MEGAGAEMVTEEALLQEEKSAVIDGELCELAVEWGTCRLVVWRCVVSWASDVGTLCDI